MCHPPKKILEFEPKFCNDAGIIPSFRFVLEHDAGIWVVLLA